MTCRSSLRSLRTSRQHAESTIHQIKCLVIIIVLNLANLVTDMLSDLVQSWQAAVTSAITPCPDHDAGQTPVGAEVKDGRQVTAAGGASCVLGMSVLHGYYRSKSIG